MELSADVVIVGYGCAGAAAALAVAERGGTAIVLEKQGPERHTPSLRMSGGMVMMLDNAEAGGRYLDACAAGSVPAAVSRAWAERATDLLEWLDEQGVEAGLTRCAGAEHPDFEGADAVAVYQPGGVSLRLDPSGGAGRALYGALTAAVAARPGVTIAWESPAERLVKSAEGRVTGVIAGGRTYSARAGVILCCGGYEMDEQMKRDFLPAYPTYFYGNPGNTGDGIRMALAAGADLWHMNLMIGRAIGNFELAPGRWQAFIIGIAPPGYVITDRAGRRFADEDPQARLGHAFYYELLRFDPQRGVFPRIPAYWFFDERRRLAGPLTLAHLGAGAVGIYDWSPDNSREIERGWIHAGRTVEEAAAAAGVEDPEQAARSVATYNSGCAAGADEFGRSAASLVPLDRGPFYCVPLWPGGSNTSGGPRRDDRARVLDPYGAPIPGLFAAGELGQAIGTLYPADGGNLSEALCFGQIAAESALAGRG